VRSHTARTEADLRLELLVSEHFGRVAAYLLSRTDGESAAEALAKTLEIAWRRLEDVPSEPLPWLLGIARRVLSDQWRGQNRRDALIARLGEIEAMRQRGFENEGGVSQDSAVDRLIAIKALAALTETDREALLLVAWDGLTTREASAVLGCTRSAFSVRLFRARSRLRDLLSAPLTGGPDSARSHAPEGLGLSAHQFTRDPQEKKP
jgi:RNA polymerase sigma-70 factor (ECF subfamily)